MPRTSSARCSTSCVSCRRGASCVPKADHDEEEEEEGTMTLHNGSRVGHGRVAVIAAVLLATVGIGTVGSAFAAESEGEHEYASDFGMGVGAVFVDLLYMPIKFVYA